MKKKINKFNSVFLDEYVNEYCKRYAFSGVIRVTEKDKILYEKAIGFADFEKQISFDNNSMFTFYSMTKPFCAIGLLKLYDKGLIDLEDHPQKYLQEMQGFNKDLKIRHLLHHVSGLPDFEQTTEYKEQNYNKEENLLQELTQIKKITQGAIPETETKYANINFIVCALIIEKVSGLSFAEYMKQEVFAPLGMKTAVVDTKGMVIKNNVQGHECKDGKFYPVEKSYRWLKGGGDIVGTVDDVYCLNKAIKNKLLLKEETWAQVLTPLSINEFGMGCLVRAWHDKKAVWHNGGHSGFRTLHVQTLEDDFDLILMSNYGGGNGRYDLAEAVYVARYGLDVEEQSRIQMDKGYIKEEDIDKNQAKNLLKEIYCKQKEIKC